MPGLIHTLNFGFSGGEIKLLEVSKEGGRYQVRACRRSSLAKGDLSSQAGLLRDLTSGLPPNALRVAFSIWDPHVVVRKISIPLMTPRELKGAMRFEAEKHIPFTIEDCLLDYVVVARHESSKEMEVILIAVKKGLVEEKIEFFREAGYEIDFVDIHPFALYNAFQAFRDPGSRALALIHLGHAGNFIHISKSAKPALVRDLGTLEGEGEGVSRDREIHDLMDNIKASVLFFENSFDESLDEVYLGGWGFGIEGFVADLEESLGKKLKPWSIALGVQFADDGVREEFTRGESEYLVPMGLAVRSLK